MNYKEIDKEFREKWIKIVDLIANARGIVDLVEAEKIGKDLIQAKLKEQREELKEKIKGIKHKWDSDINGAVVDKREVLKII